MVVRILIAKPRNVLHICTTADYYWPGGGKEGQFPPNFGQRSKASVARTPSSNPTEHFVLSAHVVLQDQDKPSESGIMFDDKTVVDIDTSPKVFVSQALKSFSPNMIPTFMDSGASDTMFVSRDVFADYKATALRTGDLAKATDGSFDIVGEGKVIQHYLVEGKEKTITYTRALHTPTLNANLISISAFDKAGLTTTFAGGQGTIRKRDGTVVLTERGEKGMYVVDALEKTNQNIPDNPLAMSSLSKPTSLEQWHRRSAIGTL